MAFPGWSWVGGKKVDGFVVHVLTVLKWPLQRYWVRFLQSYVNWPLSICMFSSSIIMNSLWSWSWSIIGFDTIRENMFECLLCYKNYLWNLSLHIWNWKQEIYIIHTTLKWKTDLQNLNDLPKNIDRKLQIKVFKCVDFIWKRP